MSKKSSLKVKCDVLTNNLFIYYNLQMSRKSICRFNSHLFRPNDKNNNKERHLSFLLPSAFVYNKYFQDPTSEVCIK